MLSKFSVRDLEAGVEKYIHAESPIAPGKKTDPRIYLAYKDGKPVGYYPLEVLDLRWKKQRWQRVAWSPTNSIYDLPHICVQKVPRRHGKTHNNVFEGVSYLHTVPLPRPIGAYYAVEKGQNVRNTMLMFEQAISRIPGGKINWRDGVITFPRPMLFDPKDYVTLYFFGVQGGSGGKRGQYYDLAIFDECEHISRRFIEAVGFISVAGRPDPKVVLTGTPDGVGTLDFYLEKAKRMEKLSKRVKSGEEIDPKKIPADVHLWRGFTGRAEELGVFSLEFLAQRKAMMDPDLYEQEFGVNDRSHKSAFFYKEAVEKAEAAGNIRKVEAPPNVPLRLYYDLGIGNKSDRGVIGVFQFIGAQVFCLWARDYKNLSYEELLIELANDCFFLKTHKIMEHVLPHDVMVRQQTNKVEKIDYFDKARIKLGIGGAVRPLRRPKDVKMDVPITRRILRATIFNEFETTELIDALSNHRRKKDKATGEFEEKSAKTKYRDLADMFRGMAVDFDGQDYSTEMPLTLDSPTVQTTGPRIKDARFSSGGHPKMPGSFFTEVEGPPGGGPLMPNKLDVRL